MMTVGSWAQQAISDVNNLTAPQVNADGSVTFQLYAPKAITASVTGDFGTLSMKEGKVVMPNGNANSDAAPGEWDKGMYKPSFTGHAASKPVASTEKAFKDIVSYVDKHYRTLADKKNRAICGLSMGGGHSFAISRLYPDWFNYVGLFSAYVHLDVKDRDELQAKGCCFTPNSERMLQTLFKKKPTLYWIAIGKDDFLYDNNKMYREYLDQKGYPYEYVETDGGHIWRTLKS